MTLSYGGVEKTIKEVFPMGNLTKLILDLLHTTKLKGKLLKFEDILKHIPEQIRYSETTKKDVRIILDRFHKNKLITKSYAGYKFK